MDDWSFIRLGICVEGFVAKWCHYFIHKFSLFFPQEKCVYYNWYISSMILVASDRSFC